MVDIMFSVRTGLPYIVCSSYITNSVYSRFRKNMNWRHPVYENSTNVSYEHDSTCINSGSSVPFVIHVNTDLSQVPGVSLHKPCKTRIRPNQPNEKA